MCWPHNQNQKTQGNEAFPSICYISGEEVAGPLVSSRDLFVCDAALACVTIVTPEDNVVGTTQKTASPWAPSGRKDEKDIVKHPGLKWLLKANMYVFNWITFEKLFLVPPPGIASIASIASSHPGHAHCCRASWRPPWPLTRLQQGLLDVPLPWNCVPDQALEPNSNKTTHDKFMFFLNQSSEDLVFFPNCLGIVLPILCFLPSYLPKPFFSSFLSASAQVPVSCCHVPWVADPKCKIGHANRGVTPRTKTMDSVNAWQCKIIPRKTISTKFSQRHGCRTANTAVDPASLQTHDFSSVYLQEPKSHLVLQAFWNWVQAQATNNEDNNDCHLYQGQSKSGLCCQGPRSNQHKRSHLLHFLSLSVLLIFHAFHMEAKINKQIKQYWKFAKEFRALHNWKGTEQNDGMLFLDGIERRFKIMTTLKPKLRASCQHDRTKLAQMFHMFLKKKLEARTSSWMH